MRKYMYRFEKPPIKIYIQYEETLKRSEASEAQCWAWMCLGTFPSQTHLLLDVFFCRDLCFKPYTEQSQHGLPLCPFVVSLLAMSHCPLLLQLRSLLLLLLFCSQSSSLWSRVSLDSCCWSHSSARPGPCLLMEIGEHHHQEALLSASTPTLSKKGACGRACRGRILDLHGLCHIILHFIA